MLDTNFIIFKLKKNQLKDKLFLRYAKHKEVMIAWKKMYFKKNLLNVSYFIPSHYADHLPVRESKEFLQLHPPSILKYLLTFRTGLGLAVSHRSLVSAAESLGSEERKAPHLTHSVWSN